MSETLHITNGDSAASIIRESGVTGYVLPWRDPMHHGPFPKRDSLNELSRIRHAYLIGSSELGRLLAEEPVAEEVERDSNEPADLTSRDQRLHESPACKEVVLWFEHDVLDQLQLLQILDWYSRADLSQTKLTLICIDKFDGVANFRGLGQLTPEQLASLYPARVTVTPEQLKLAQVCWQAFCESSPLTLASQAQKIMPDLPFVAATCKRVCQEYPWSSDGLTRTERQILNLVKSGHSNPNKVFVENMDFEENLYIGDWRTFSQIKELCEAKQPLLALAGGEEFKHPVDTTVSKEQFKSQKLQVTEYGLDVLAGKVAASKVMTRDNWIGGVCLADAESSWLWNDELERFN